MGESRPSVTKIIRMSVRHFHAPQCKEVRSSHTNIIPDMLLKYSDFNVFPITSDMVLIVTLIKSTICAANYVII